MAWLSVKRRVLLEQRRVILEWRPDDGNVAAVRHSLSPHEALQLADELTEKAHRALGVAPRAHPPVVE